MCGKRLLRCKPPTLTALHAANPNGAIAFQCLPGVNHILYPYQDRGGQTHTIPVHVVQCEETWTDAQGKSPRRVWAWISSQPLTSDNGVARCNRDARPRWDIESTF
jgi:hypothetical protein